MRRSILIIVLTFFISISSMGQYQDEKTSGLDVHIMPFTILDYTPRYRIGLEYKTSKHLGYAVEIGYGNHSINGFTGIGNIGKFYQFQELRPEIKYYFAPTQYSNNHYVALELFYLQQGEIFFDDYYHNVESANDMLIHYDQASFQKSKMGGHLKA